MLHKALRLSIVLSTLLSIYTCFSPPAQLPRNTVLSRNLSKGVVVSAQVAGEYQIDRITGWTSPFAEVSLSAPRVARKTIADASGYFIFIQIPVPEKPGEICLISQDVTQLGSFPTCLGPINPARNIQINNLVLSPSISIDANQIPAGATIKASGMTFPNAEVTVYFFTNPNYSFVTAFTQKLGLLSIVKKAYASGLPGYSIKSNQNGYFEFTLPSSVPATSRLFSASHLSIIRIRDNPLAESAKNYYDIATLDSPKSNTLSFQSLGLWELFLRWLKQIFAALATLYFRPQFTTLLTLEIATLLTLVYFLFRPKTALLPLPKPTTPLSTAVPPKLLPPPSMDMFLPLAKYLPKSRKK